MSFSVKDIQDAIYTKLNSTSPFRTAVGGRINCMIGDASELLSHCVFNIISTKYLRNFSSADDIEVIVQIDIYVPKTSGASVLSDITQKLEVLLDMGDIIITGFAHSTQWSTMYTTSVEDSFLRARSEYLIYGTVH